MTATTATAAATSTPTNVAMLQSVITKLHQELHRQQEAAAAAATEAKTQQQGSSERLQEAADATEVVKQDLAKAKQQMSTLQQQVAAAERAREAAEAVAAVAAQQGECVAGTVAVAIFKANLRLHHTLCVIAAGLHGVVGCPMLCNLIRVRQH